MKTMYDFEIACKNVIIGICEQNFNETYTIQDISVVWSCKTLGNKKAILIDNGENNRMYEFTFNGNKDELYVDVYEKAFNQCYITSSETFQENLIVKM